MDAGSLPGNHMEAKSLILSVFLKRIILRLEQSCGLHSALSFFGTYQPMVRMSSVGLHSARSRSQRTLGGGFHSFIPSGRSQSLGTKRSPVPSRYERLSGELGLGSGDGPIVISFTPLYQFGTRKSRVCSNYEEMPCCDFPFGFF